MTLERLLFFTFLMIPFIVTLIHLARIFGAFQSWRPYAVNIASSISKILILFLLMRVTLTQNSIPSLVFPIIRGYDLELLLQMTWPKECFLFGVELVYLFYYLSEESTQRNSISGMFLSIVVVGISAFISAADVSYMSGGFIFWMAFGLFYLVQSMESSMAAEITPAPISGRLFRQLVMLGVLFVALSCTGVRDFNGALVYLPSLIFSMIFVAMVFLVISFIQMTKEGDSIKPWNARNIQLILGVCVASIFFKLSFLADLYPLLAPWQSFLVALLGVTGSIVCLYWGSTSAQSRLGAALLGFLFFQVFFCVGIFDLQMLKVIQLLMMTIPPLIALMLFTERITNRSFVSVASGWLMVLLLLGIPGSPLFFTFSAIAARSYGVHPFFLVFSGFLWVSFLFAALVACLKVWVPKLLLENGLGNDQAQAKHFPFWQNQTLASLAFLLVFYVCLVVFSFSLGGG